MSRSKWIDAVLVVMLVVACFRVYRASPGTAQMCDSCYALTVSEKLIRHGSIRLDSLIPSDTAARAKLPGFVPELGHPYHLRTVPATGGIVYAYPLGTSVLSVPAVAYYSCVRGTSSLSEGEGYDPEGERVLQLKVAAGVSAAAVGVFFLIARSFVPTPIAFLLAGGFGFGSMVWSTLSRALWSHTWAVLLLSLAVLGIVRLTREPRFSLTQFASGLGFGTLLFWMVLVRPQTAISGLSVVAFLAVWHWRAALTTCVTGLTWIGLFVSWSFATFGTPTPPSTYSGEKLDLAEMLFRCGALLASPSRGLLVFCPYLAVFGYLLLAHRRSLPDARLLVPAGLAVLGYGVVFSGYSGWHGGYCYGPRHLSDLLPWFVLAGSITVGGLIRSQVPAWRKGVEATVLVACFAFAGFAHGRGAVSDATWWWNYRCRDHADHVKLAVDWQHPQFLAGLTYRVLPDGSFAPR
jgi:hypothetical protein